MRKSFYVLLVVFLGLLAGGCGTPEETKKAQADNPTVVIVIPQDDSADLDKSLDQELSKFVDTMKIKVQPLPDKTNKNLSLTTTFSDSGTGSTITEFGLHEVNGILAAVEVIIPGIGKKAMLMRADDASNPVVVLCQGGRIFSQGANEQSICNIPLGSLVRIQEGGQVFAECSSAEYVLRGRPFCSSRFEIRLALYLAYEKGVYSR
jgi:hypothetical protein